MRANIPKAYVAAFLKNLQFFGAIAVPYFLDWLRVDYTRMFLLQAWFLFWVFTLEIPTGIVADKFGRKASVAAGCLLFGADMWIFGFVRSLPVLFFAEFLGAIGMTLISGAEQALLYDSLKALKVDDRARHYLSKYEAAGTLGLVLSFPLGSFIGGLGAYPGQLPVPFAMTGASALVAAGVYFLMREPERGKAVEGFIRMGMRGMKTLFAHRDLRAFVLNAVTISSVTFFAFWFYQPVARQGGLSVKYLGFLGAGFNLFSTILLSNTAVLERAFGLRRLLFATALLPGLLFCALGRFHALAFVIPAFFLLVGCKLVRMPILNDYINRYIESENRATVISSVSLLERAISFVLYPVVGALADFSPDYALYFLGTLCIALAVGTRLTDRQFVGDGGS